MENKRRAGKVSILSIVLINEESSVLRGGGKYAKIVLFQKLIFIH